MSTDSPSLCPGQTLGRYELLAAVAKGGMGQVWVARLRGARGFQKLVAIKTLLAVGEDSERSERMLFEEARIAGLIQHSNVVQTIELGEERGTLYLAMEWVDGEPLSYLLSHCEAGNGIPLLIAVNLVGQTLRGLQAAHDLSDDSGASLGVVHRDVSPHNVLVSYTGVAKLVDFGIAKAMNQQLDSSTSTGEIKGKFAYMAPEQILGNPVDRRADIFSAGIMLHLMTSGHHPFKNHKSVGVLHSITSSVPAARPSLLKAGYSRTLEAVVMRALEKDRERRFRSADEMRLALQKAVPEAFAAGFDAEVAAFMSASCGQRAIAKRELLRRVEQRSDTRMAAERSLAKGGASAQSASSLRAVSVDTSATDAEESAHPSFLPTLQPPPESPAAAVTRRRPWLVAAVIATGLIGTWAVLAKSPNFARGGHAANSAMVQLLPSSTTHVRLAAPPPALPELVAPSLSASTKGPSPVAQPAIGPAKSKPAKARARSRSTSAPSDLIAPDYAR